MLRSLVGALPGGLVIVAVAGLIYAGGPAGMQSVLFQISAGAGILLGGLQIALYFRREEQRKRDVEAANTSAAQAQRRFLQMARSASDWFWETDAEGRFTYFSKDLEDITGYPYEALIGKRRQDLIPDLDAPEVRAHLEDLAAHRPFRNFRYYPVFPNGQRHICDVSGMPRYDAEGKFIGYSGAVSDVTDQVRASEAAERASTRLVATLEAIRAPVALYDVEGRLHLFNTRMQDVYDALDIPLEEGMPFADILDAVGKSGCVAVAKTGYESWKNQEVETFESGDGELSLREIDGRTYQPHIHVLEDGGRLVIDADISAAREQAKAYQESYRILQSALDSIIQGIAVYDSDLSLVTCNRHFIGLFELPEHLARPGAKLEDIIRWNIKGGWHGSVAETDTDALVADRLTVFASDETTTQVFERGEDKMVQLSIHSIPGGGRVATYTDITDSRHNETQLRHAKEEAEFANRTKSTFLANMSHELRTPLNAIIGFAEVIRDELYGPLGNPQYQDFAKDIRESGQHLLDLINDILDLSKIEAGQREISESEINLPGVVNATLRIVRQRAMEAEITLAADLNEDLGPLYAEERSLRQMLLNLISNAIKFTPKNGRITIGARKEIESGDLLVTVADTGIGIAETDIPKAMQPFQQIDSELNRTYTGTGLGLPLVKSLIELHDGTVAIESALGEGTTVILRFPKSRTEPRRLIHPPTVLPEKRGAVDISYDEIATPEKIADSRPEENARDRVKRPAE